MVQVGDLDLEDVFAPLVHGALHRGAGNIRLAVGDGLGDIRQDTLLVVAGHLDPDRHCAPLGPVPCHIDPPLRVALRGQGTIAVWTVTPLPRVMKPTMSSPGTGLQHLPNRTMTSSIPLIWMALADLPVNCSITLASRDLLPLLPLLQLVRRKELAEDLVAGQLAVTDRGHEVVLGSKTEFVSRPLDLTALLEFGKVEGITAEILFANLPAEGCSGSAPRS